ncbi:Hypothetical predicted protein [Paramuricea clavata]|uniref:Uncharacterized protein n=1 Tax=Paramuricea clavata TaxID=317549 RepID=A0A7D9EAB9_PARCT|nr:Hypothetical predicted protein [Paramuricea clavata]
MSTVKKGEVVRMYFERPDIVDFVKEMLSLADYKDIIFSVEDVLHFGRNLKISGHRIKLGSGWMGKNYKVNWIYGVWGLKGFVLTIRMYKLKYRTCIGRCTIGTVKNRISLDYPSKVSYGREEEDPWRSMDYQLRWNFNLEMDYVDSERDDVNRIGKEMQEEQDTEEILWDKVD